MMYNVNNMKRSKKELTLEDISSSIDALTSVTKRGFESVEKRLDRVEQRLTNVEVDLSDVQSKMCNVAYKIDVRDHEVRLRNLEKQVFAS